MEQSFLEFSFRSFGQPLEVSIFPDYRKIPKYCWARSIWGKKNLNFRFEIKWNSHFGIVHFENFGQPLQVNPFFYRNVGIIETFLFDLMAGNFGNSNRNFCPIGSRPLPPCGNCPQYRESTSCKQACATFSYIRQSRNKNKQEDIKVKWGAW